MHFHLESSSSLKKKLLCYRKKNYCVTVFPHSIEIPFTQLWKLQTQIKNLLAILSSIITVHIGHFLFREKKNSKTPSSPFFFCPKISVVGFDVVLSGFFKAQSTARQIILEMEASGSFN